MTGQVAEDLNAWSGKMMHCETRCLVCAMTPELAKFAVLTSCPLISIGTDPLHAKQSPRTIIYEQFGGGEGPYTGQSLASKMSHGLCDLQFMYILILLVLITLGIRQNGRRNCVGFGSVGLPFFVVRMLRGDELI